MKATPAPQNVKFRGLMRSMQQSTGGDTCLLVSWCCPVSRSLLGVGAVEDLDIFRRTQCCVEEGTESAGLAQWRHRLLEAASLQKRAQVLASLTGPAHPASPVVLPTLTEAKYRLPPSLFASVEAFSNDT